MGSKGKRTPRRFTKFYDALGQAAMDFGARDTISVGISLKVKQGMPLKIRVTPLTAREAGPARGKRASFVRARAAGEGDK